MKSLLVLIGLLAAAPALAAHPGSDAKCENCHALGSGDAKAPKVVPQEPGFFARLFGKKSMRGHPSVSCAGAVKPDGTLTGCHRPEDGKDGLLVVDVKDKPADLFCVRCHADVGKTGGHHPTYKVDRNKDGVPETLVRPAAGQEIYTAFAPGAKGEPLATYPDALVLKAMPDGTKKLDAVLPLRTVLEPDPQGKMVAEKDIVTCSTCHNAHYGYLVEAGTEEELNREQVARPKGDALLRLRDQTNALCDACH